jgi:hypothetical protein
LNHPHPAQDSHQGERTQDQSGFTNISALNVSDMNDSRNISNRHDSVDNSQSADVIDQPANESKTNDSVVSEDNYVDKPIVNGRLDSMVVYIDQF